MDFSFARYLNAKRTVDDRALNRYVLDTLRTALADLRTGPRVVEVGGGVGTMFQRVLEWQLLRPARYEIVDVCPELLKQAKSELRDWALGHGYAALERADGLELRDDDSACELSFQARDIGELSASAEGAKSDLLIACAVLDLVDVAKVLPKLWSLLKPGGLFWFSINFDGESIFVPELELDAQVFELYHRSMDRRALQGRPPGDSKAGRHLFQHLAASGAEIIASGSSDWVVHSVRGAYRDDEAYFLHYIVHTIATELASHPELDKVAFENWCETRHLQIEQGKLVYIAHQLDFLGRAPA